MPLYKTPALLTWIYPSFLWKKQTNEKKLFLTFDDGPVEGITDYVLEELKKYNAKATFFCVGENIDKYPHVFQRIIDQQHQAGNHTFNHLNGWKTKNRSYVSNVEKCEEVINKNSNNKSRKLFRPPYGKIKFQQARKLSHLQIVMWDVLTYDFDMNISAKDSLEKTIRYTRKGSIVIFHDSIKSEKKLKQMLPRYLDHFTQLGYQFEAL